jgi:hypothetical protein
MMHFNLDPGNTRDGSLGEADPKETEAHTAAEYNRIRCEFGLARPKSQLLAEPIATVTSRCVLLQNKAGGIIGGMTLG